MHACTCVCPRPSESQRTESDSKLPHPLTPSLENNLSPRIGALPLSLPVLGAPGAWEGSLVFHGGSTWPARSLPSLLQSLKSSCPPPDGSIPPTLSFPTQAPHSGADLQASKRVSRLGTGAPLLFLGLTEGVRGSDLDHPSHPSTSCPQNAADCLLVYSGRIQEDTQKSSTLVPVFDSRSQLLKILAPHLFLQVTQLEALAAWVSDRGRRWWQTLPAT